MIPTVLLSPGSPVEIGNGGFGPLLTAIAADGVWHAWTYDPITGWKDVSIGPGYIMGAPMALLPGEGTLFTVDGLGRLVIASPLATGWGVSFGIPSINYTPSSCHAASFLIPLCRPRRSGSSTRRRMT